MGCENVPPTRWRAHLIHLVSESKLCDSQGVAPPQDTRRRLPKSFVTGGWTAEQVVVVGSHNGGEWDPTKPSDPPLHVVWSSRLQGQSFAEAFFKLARPHLVGQQLPGVWLLWGGSLGGRGSNPSVLPPHLSRQVEVI